MCFLLYLCYRGVYNYGPLFTSDEFYMMHISFNSNLISSIVGVLVGYWYYHNEKQLKENGVPQGRVCIPLQFKNRKKLKKITNFSPYGFGSHCGLF